MPTLSNPHHGSLQFWPRKRVDKRLPSVNWSVIHGKDKSQSILGFISYKVGMASAVVKDLTENSMTKGKKIFLPVTILEAPNMQVFSIRFYKFGKVVKEVIVFSIQLARVTNSSTSQVTNFSSHIANLTVQIHSILLRCKYPCLGQLLPIARFTRAFRKYQDALQHGFRGIRLCTSSGLQNSVSPMRFGLLLYR